MNPNGEFFNSVIFSTLCAVGRTVVFAGVLNCIEWFRLVFILIACFFFQNPFSKGIYKHLANEYNRITWFSLFGGWKWAGSQQLRGIRDLVNALPRRWFQWRGFCSRIDTALALDWREVEKMNPIWRWLGGEGWSWMPSECQLVRVKLIFSA